MRVAFINNEFIEESRASLNIQDLAIRRGFGIFDFFRTVGLKPLFIDEHLQRFYNSADKVNLKIPYSVGDMKNICTDMLRRNKIEGGGVRIVLTGGYSENAYTPGDPNLVITNEPLKLVDEETRSKGIKVISHNFQREFPEVKTINYFTGIMLQGKAQAEGAFDILYHNDGKVREFTRSNIFIIKENKLITPQEALLKGVTRNHILKLATGDHTVEERDITYKEVGEADEVFMTGTTKRVLPVVQVDDMIIGSGKPGAVTMSLYEKFFQLEQNYTSTISI